jgi:sulfur relay (sulfurtransferase) DsrF/TusC family protein
VRSRAFPDDGASGDRRGSDDQVLVIVNDQPYGGEPPYNALRIAGSLSKRDEVALRVFLLGDAVGCAAPRRPWV